VSTNGTRPAGRHATECCVIQYRLDVSTEPVHLADRLLGEHWHYPIAKFLERAGVSTCRQTYTVASADRHSVPANRSRPEVRKRLPQRGGVSGRERTLKDLTCGRLTGSSLERRECCGRARGDIQAPTCVINARFKRFVPKSHR